jgi:flagellar motility protein MotE (MotC chaperone)
LALKQAAQPESDRVVAITFAEDGVEEKEVKAPTEQQAWPPAPRVTWGSAAKTEKKRKPADSAKELQLQIDEIRAQQAALEESKYAGRDIDEADEEIAALEERKTALKEQLPRKRFLWIF